MHRIVNKWSLVDFTPGSYSSTPAVYLSFYEESFENRIVGVNFESEAVRFLCLNWLLSSEHRARFSLVKIKSKGPRLLGILVFSRQIVYEVIEGTKFSVYIFDKFVVYVSKNILVVIKAERMIHLFNERSKSLSQLNFDRLFENVHIFDCESWCR